MCWISIQRWPATKKIHNHYQLTHVYDCFLVMKCRFRTCANNEAWMVFIVRTQAKDTSEISVNKRIALIQNVL